MVFSKVHHRMSQTNSEEMFYFLLIAPYASRFTFYPHSTV